MEDIRTAFLERDQNVDSLAQLKSGERCGATKYFNSRWSFTKNFYNVLKTEKTNHLITFGVYSIPLLGTAIKIVDGLFFGSRLISVSKYIDIESVDFDSKFKELQFRVAELQVNDFLFFVSRFLHLVVIELLVPSIAPFAVLVLIIDFFVSSILLTLRLSFSTIESDRLFRVSQVIDLFSIREMFASCAIHPADKAQIEKNSTVFSALVSIFKIYPKDRKSLAKKLTDSGGLDALMKLYCVKENPIASKARWEWIKMRLNQAIKEDIKIY